MEKLYTVGKAAQLLSLSPRKTASLIDSGILEGIKLPGSLHRRVSHSTILAFIKANKLPMPDGFDNKTSTIPTPDPVPVRIRLLHSTLQTRLAYCSSDTDTITHLLQFRDDVMKAINDN